MHAHGGSPDPLDRTRFPIDEWALRERRYSREDLGVTETLFAVGNGYLGMRGNCEEGRDTHSHGTFVNGFHETWQIRHAEEAFGFARTGQTIVNVPDVKTIKLYVDDEPLLLSVADLEHYERALDFREGVLRRSLIWRTASGKRVKVDSRRLVSLEHRHLAVMTFEVTMLDGDAPIAISSQLLNRQDGLDEYATQSLGAGEAGFDPRQASKLSERVLVPQSHWAGDRRMVLSWRAASSRMTLAVGVDHTIATDNEYEELTHAEEDLAKKVYRVRAVQGKPIRITKVAAYHSSRGVPTRELVDRCRRTLDRVREEGVEECFASQRLQMEAFWDRSDVVVEGHPAVQQAIRWNLFQLAQASLRVETAGIAAKGVSGSGYEGHYFWDSEIYVLPFLTYTSPWVARGALRFRYTMLPAARRRAHELSQVGALFPWRTISGEEASAYYAAGTAQYHINADISFALCKYVNATGDEDFMVREGVEILVETARMWEDLGFWLAGDPPQFHIHAVTGPDEYTTVVNNNLFTNLMARDNLRQAARWCRHIAEHWPENYERLVRQLDLDPDEVQEWARCADGMHVPYDEALKVHPQDQHFLEREVWDLAATPADKRPLLLHYHPLVIYRFQVVKQADVVAALFLQGEEFSRDSKRADFEYYDPITTGDSTLSAVVQAIIAAEVGYQNLALRYFYAGLYVDLANLHGNASDGIHVASTGGVWSALVYGFAGMRDYHDSLTFDPRLPREWPGLSFTIRFHGARLHVHLEREQISFTLLEGNAVAVSVRGERHVVGPNEPVVVPLEDQGPVIERELGNMPLIGSSTEHDMVYTAGVPDPDRRKKNGNGQPK